MKGVIISTVHWISSRYALDIKLQTEILCGHVGREKNGAHSSRPYPRHYFARVKYWIVKTGLSECWLSVETKIGNNFGRRLVSKIELSGNIARGGGDLHRVIEEGKKILLEIYLTVMEYIDRKGEFRIVNKYVKISFSNFHT